MSRRLLAAPLLCLGLLFGGCGLSLDDVPMPSLIEGPTYELTAVFDSALNLPVDSPVKWGGRTIGQVVGVEVRDYRAVVAMEITDETRIRSGGRAEIRLTSPMGTAFVELLDGPQGNAPLEAGARIEVASTTRAPDVADLLSSLSVVVTGGAFADIGTVVDELNVALTGNAPAARALLRGLDDTVSDLNAHTADFDRALRGVNRLTRRLADDAPYLVEAVRDLRPAVRALEGQQSDLLRLLAKVRRLGESTEAFTTAVREDLVTTLDSAGPVLDSLRRSQSHLVRGMRGLIKFGALTDDASPGDFSNFDLTLLLDPDGLNPTSGQPQQPDGARGQEGGR
ncbi:MlaD family protein [Nocardioides dubius]|uniref:Phospholipid/cholesterol/gamma-HCH transport system substrate-binding protein n=1 Tax=Nocardioides dubius TaxID=317019 RepID=A0ABP4EHV8_9ACTN